MPNPTASTGSKKGKDVPGGAVVITGQGRFFSNGLDYEKAMKNPRFFEEVFDPVMYRLLTFPLVTIAAINGHAFAGGMVLALACDYRIMTSGKGMMCMNEISFGSPLPNSFASLLNLRIPHPQHIRNTLLGHRFSQKDLIGMGLVDEVVDDVGEGKEGGLMRRAVEVGEREGVRVGFGVWGVIKDQLYHSVIEASRSNRPILLGPQAAKQFWDRVGKSPAKAKL